LNGPHQLLGYADDVTLLGDNITKTKEALTVGSKVVGQRGRIQKTKWYVVTSPECRQKL
jgi:hypothetical protein